MASSSFRRDLTVIPDVADFAFVLSEEPRWSSVGIQLGLFNNDLTLIRQNLVHPNIHDQYSEVYSKLEMQCNLKTWGEIVEALKRLGNENLARKIAGDQLFEKPTIDSSPAPSQGRIADKGMKQSNQSGSSWRKIAPSSLRQDLSVIPTCKEFVKVLVAERDWFGFGLFLGVSLNDLKNFERNSVKLMYTIHQYYAEVYANLERNNSLKTWGEIADTARDFGNDDIYRRITGKRLRGISTTDTVPPAVRLAYPKQKVKYLKGKIEKWAPQRENTLKKLKDIADRKLLKAARSVYELNIVPTFLAAGARAWTISKEIQQCVNACSPEHTAYKEMMKEFRTFGRGIRNVLDLSVVGDIETVSFDSLDSPSPISNSIKLIIEQLRDEMENICSILEFLEDRAVE